MTDQNIHFAGPNRVGQDIIIVGTNFVQQDKLKKLVLPIIQKKYINY
jgi:hypothetical protein